jgi:hypothetical protein
MLLVKCRLELSPIDGLGVFALERIRAGKMIWRYDPKVDRVYSFSDYHTATLSQQLSLRHFAYINGEKEWVLCGDIAVFTNHADEPNTVDRYETSVYGEDYAARDIEPGEEITCDYSKWDADWGHKLPLTGR